eukprot:gnl/MRDRNA2_/MRDRNA2_64835_c0_seq1.p1 gnl/MRDRNA2_/MRDRNA2_64835_c0~~gnl/MRDRNA2_/MRDRNA2_64835_c0_seq1.p1  ORF type:complete len:339 (+),score=42.58 gnl/MRDRNA2_/MRDRNA2_64835_c0_seq1:78-1094(+)
MHLRNVLAVLVFILIPAISKAGRLHRYRSKSNGVLGSFNRQQAAQLHSESDQETANRKSLGVAKSVCDHFESKQVQYQDDYTMHITCTEHEHHYKFSSESTTYLFEVKVEGPENVDTSFAPKPQRAIKISSYHDDVDIPVFKISLGQPNSISHLEAIRPLWSDLGDALNLCQWSIMGNYNSLWLHLDSEVQLRCYMPGKYLYHTFIQTYTPEASAMAQAFNAASAMKICDALKSKEVHSNTKWVMTIKCSMAHHEKWYSSKQSTYQYQIELKGPNDEKAVFVPEPQRPVFNSRREEPDVLAEIALGAPQESVNGTPMSRAMCKTYCDGFRDLNSQTRH